MAADNTTYGVKVSAETKDKITSMIDASGLSSKEWFERLLALYELQVYKQHEGSIKYLSDIETLQDHTKRIDEIFASLVKKVIDDHKEHINAIKQVSREKEQVVQRLELELIKQQSELTEVKHELSESQEKVTRLDDLSISHKETIRCLSVEIDRLNNQIASYNEAEFEQLSTHLQIVKKDIVIAQLSYDKEISELKEQHRLEIDKLTSKKSSPSNKKLGRPSKKVDLENLPLYKLMLL